jgi:hypothetical protein
MTRKLVGFDGVPLARFDPAVRADEALGGQLRILGEIERFPSLPIEQSPVVQRRSRPAAIRARVHGASINHSAVIPSQLRRALNAANRVAADTARPSRKSFDAIGDFAFRVDGRDAFNEKIFLRT